MNFIVPQIIGAPLEKENLLNFLVCEVLEIGMIMQLLLMAQIALFDTAYFEKMNILFE